MKFYLYHPSVHSIPSGQQFRKVYFSLDMDSAPLEGKINFYRKMREIIYSELRKGELTIIKVENLLERVSTKVKKEKENSRDIHMKN